MRRAASAPPALPGRVVLSILPALLAGCAGSHDALNPTGPFAGRIADLWWSYFAVTLAVYAAVVITLVIALLRSRRREPPPDHAGQAAANQRARRIVGTAVALTVLTLVALALGDFLTGRILAREPEHPLRILLIGHQWWWEIQYEDPVPANRITTANEMHVPVGRPIALSITSQDVIHSAWLPNINGKRDLIPGYMNTLYLQVERPGRYEGQCAEYCGYQHAKMRLVLLADTPERFAAWQAHTREPSRAPQTQAERHGQQVFLNASCVMCHSIQGTPASASVAPDLTHLATRTRIAAGSLPNTPSWRAAWVTDPQAFKPGTQMPANILPPADFAALMAYLSSLD